MAKITAILDDQEAAAQVTDQLSALNIDGLDWRLVEPGDDNERILPAFGMPLGGATNTPAGGPLGVPVQYDLPEDEALKNRGVDRDESVSYGKSVAHGGTVIIIEAPSDHEEQIRRILERADAQQIDTE